jgi:hypothetical protein
MRLNALKSGQFFEFRSAGFCFRKCLFVGIDSYGMVNFLHETAGADRFLLNNVPSEHNPKVEVELPQDWTFSGWNYYDSRI